MPTQNEAKPRLLQEFDPIDIEIIRNRLIAIPNLIEKNIERTAFSLLVQEYKDYAVGFTDRRGLLVTQSRYSLPSFVANAIGLAVRDGLEVFGAENLHAGDVVITNGPVIGKHLNDVVAYTPVRVDGELVGFFCVLVHWIDIGGNVVGSCFSPTATDRWQEGTLYPTVKLISEGRRNDDLFRLISGNSRFPGMLRGDLEAQLGGCQMGHDLVQELVGEYGVEPFKATIATMFSDAEAAAERAVRRLPEGEYTARAFMDNDGVELDRRMEIDVKIIIRDGRMIFDLSGLGKQVRGPVNLTKNGGALAVARLAYKFLLASSTPVNEGDFSQIDLVVPDGTFLSASPDAACGSGGYTGNTIIDTLIRALAPALPDDVPAAHHGIYGIHTISGRQPETGEPWMCLDAMSGGWGGRRERDGAGPLRSMVHGDVRDVPVEIQEALYPYRIEVKRLREDSGGAGRHRGGLGIEKVYSFPFDVPLTLNVNVERTQCPPWGLEGGGEGQVAEAIVLRADGSRDSLKKDEKPVSKGDTVLIRSGGGGGFGAPREREVGAVLDDLRQGYISRSAAEETYGVVLDPEGKLDERATAARRGAETATSSGSGG